MKPDTQPADARTAWAGQQSDPPPLKPYAPLIINAAIAGGGK